VPLQPRAGQKVGIRGARDRMPAHFWRLCTGNGSTEGMSNELGAVTDSEYWHPSLHCSCHQIRFRGNFFLVALPVHRPLRPEQQHEIDSRQRLPLARIFPFISLECKAEFNQPSTNQARVGISAVANNERTHSDTVVD